MFITHGGGKLGLEIGERPFVVVLKTFLLERVHRLVLDEKTERIEAVFAQGACGLQVERPRQGMRRARHQNELRK